MKSVAKLAVSYADSLGSVFLIAVVNIIVLFASFAVFDSSGVNEGVFPWLVTALIIVLVQSLIIRARHKLPFGTAANASFVLTIVGVLVYAMVALSISGIRVFVR